MIDRKMLERQAEKGEVERKAYLGSEKIIIYRDKAIKHPDPEVYESGLILMEKGASIGSHVHNNDSELWIVIEGKVEVNGSILENGDISICNKGEMHSCINLADGDSILGFAKKNKAVYDE